MLRKNINDSLAFLSHIFGSHNGQPGQSVKLSESTNQTLPPQFNEEVQADQFKVKFWDEDTRTVTEQANKVQKISLHFLMSAPLEPGEREITIYVVGFTPDLEPIKTEVSSPFITTADGGEKTYDCMFQDSIRIYKHPRSFYYGFDLLSPFTRGGVYRFKIYTANLLVSSTEECINENKEVKNTHYDM